MRRSPVLTTLLAGVVFTASAVLVCGCAGAAANRATTTRDGCFRFAIKQVTPAAYEPTAVLAVDVIATNVTDSSCTGRSCGGVTGEFDVSDATGREVATAGPYGVDCFSDAPGPKPVAPGASVVWDSFAWDGLGLWTGSRCVPGDCTGTRPALGPGKYRFTWRWLEKVTVQSAWITLKR